MRVSCGIPTCTFSPTIEVRGAYFPVQRLSSNTNAIEYRDQSQTCSQSVEAVVHSPTMVQRFRLDLDNSSRLPQNVLSLSAYPCSIRSMVNLESQWLAGSSNALETLIILTWSKCATHCQMIEPLSITDIPRWRVQQMSNLRHLGRLPCTYRQA